MSNPWISELVAQSMRNFLFKGKSLLDSPDWAVFLNKLLSSEKENLLAAETSTDPLRVNSGIPYHIWQSMGDKHSVPIPKANGVIDYYIHNHPDSRNFPFPSLFDFWAGGRRGVREFEVVHPHNWTVLSINGPMSQYVPQMKKWHEMGMMSISPPLWRSLDPIPQTREIGIEDHPILGPWLDLLTKSSNGVE